MDAIHSCTVISTNPKDEEKSTIALQCAALAEYVNHLVQISLPRSQSENRNDIIPLFNIFQRVPISIYQSRFVSEMCLDVLTAVAADQVFFRFTD